MRTSLAALVLGLVACQGSAPPCPKAPKADCPECKQAPAPAPVVDKDEIPGQKPIEVPLGLPDGPPEAKPGQLVYAPWRDDLKDVGKGVDQLSLIMRAGVFVRAGEHHSLIENRTGAVALIPNALVVVVPENPRAKPGDTVLVYAEDGIDMDQHAVVVAGGTEEAPMVRRLTTWDPSEEEQLEPGKFTRIEAWSPGTMVACRTEGEDAHYKSTVVRVVGDKILGVGFARHPRVDDKSLCVPVPVSPKLKVGDKCFVPVIDTFYPGKVKSIDAQAGFVEVEYSWGSSPSITKYVFGTVLEKL